MSNEYLEFLKSKVIIAESYGIDTKDLVYSKIMFEHQKDITDFALRGGRRAIFANFGLGKTFIQLEIAKQLIAICNKPFLIVCPLGVSGEFKRDNRKLGTGLDINYITDTDKIETVKNQIYITNYERVRMGDIDPELFCGVSFDEASILRNLQTQTTNYILEHFKKIPYRFVATATPTPNDYIEMLNYAVYLGVASRGHLLTRFFQRDSQKAGNLKLYENKKDEFWQWVSTWAAFLHDPSDLGYDNTGYDLPELEIVEHCVEYTLNEIPLNKWGEPMMFKDTTKSLLECSREKRDSIAARMNKVDEIISTFKDTDKCIVWHHLEAERVFLESNFRNEDFVSVFGSQLAKIKEQRLIDFSDGNHKYLLTKPKIAGSGCNMQVANKMIFAGIDYKFNDFIQAIHREYRFGQTKKVEVHIIYTINEQHVLKSLYAKWNKHKELQTQMISIIKKNGLNSNLIKSQMERQMFKGGYKFQDTNVTLYNNDTVIIHNDTEEMKDNSIDMYLTSIPFGDHYEYSDNYNDFGHNHGNGKFFEQMDFLIPNMYRCLKPGRIAAIHVKDRIRYSYQNGTSFTSLSDFSGDTVKSFEKNGFFLIGKITVTTDVVAENNQTYRLGWSEKCKDGTKMGVGLPEYILLFRKPPTFTDNSYADEPVVKTKDYYTKGRWQIDAHSYWRSDGDRFLAPNEIQRLEVSKLVAAWKKLNQNEIYDYFEHIKISQDLDHCNKLSSTFMTLPMHSNNEFVWTDINRMNTLNTNQASSKKEKHICPLQFDIIERLIELFTMENEIVCDPFGGLFSTSYKAMQMNRKSISIELNSEYYNDGLHYIKALIYKLKIPTLFAFEKV
jgi:DNA modification methylase